ncbi:MAG: putative membrane protein, partial [Paracoccaceae bacterium]
MTSPFEEEPQRRPSIFARLRSSFFTGIVVIAPVSLTIWLLWTVIGWFD